MKKLGTVKVHVYPDFSRKIPLHCLINIGMKLLPEKRVKMLLNSKKFNDIP
jgi:hypothetical protein